MDNSKVNNLVTKSTVIILPIPETQVYGYFQKFGNIVCFSFDTHGNYLRAGTIIDIPEEYRKNSSAIDYINHGIIEAKGDISGSIRIRTTILSVQKDFLPATLFNAFWII